MIITIIGKIEETVMDMGTINIKTMKIIEITKITETVGTIETIEIIIEEKVIKGILENKIEEISNENDNEKKLVKIRQDSGYRFYQPSEPRHLSKARDE